MEPHGRRDQDRDPARLDLLNRTDVQVRQFREFLLRDPALATLPAQIGSETPDFRRYLGLLDHALWCRKPGIDNTAQWGVNGAMQRVPRRCLRGLKPVLFALLCVLSISAWVGGLQAGAAPRQSVPRTALAGFQRPHYDKVAPEADVATTDDPAEMEIADEPSPPSAATQPLQGDNRYHDYVCKFSITFPIGWEVKRPWAKEGLVKAVLRDSQGRLAIMVIGGYPVPPEAEDLESNLTADAIWEGLQDNEPKAKLRRLASGTMQVAATPAVFNITETYAPPELTQFQKHFHFIKGNTLFQITAMTRRDKTFFDAQMLIVDAAVATFAFDP